MTVLELIKQLKTMPKNAQVIYQAHDNNDSEIADNINTVNLIDFDKLPKCDWQENKGIFVALRN